MTNTLVTPETYIRAETDRTFYNASQLAGGVNSMFSFRQVTPLDMQKVVRMNKDTLYTVAVVDTSKGATITVPEMPAGRYFSVLLLDNDHYCPGVIYTSASITTDVCPPTDATPPPTRCPRTMRSGPLPFTARMAT